MLMKRLTLGIVVFIGVLLGGASPALAHNSLVEVLPAKDATLTEAPTEVKLRFLATLKPDTKLTVTGPDGANAAGTVTVDGKFISAPFSGTANGEYTVGYELVSDDGHPVKSTYTFTLQLPATEPVRQTESPTPASTQAAAAPVPADDETPWLPWIGGSVVAGLLVGGLLTFLRNRRERA